MRLFSSSFPQKTNMLSRLLGVSQPFHGEIPGKAQECCTSFLFDSRKSPGFDRIMLCGPPASGKTSLLFELALSFAEEEKHVLYICPKKLSKLPLLANGRTQPSSETLRFIQMVYLETKEDYLNYMASIHFSTSRKFSSIIVDDLSTYLPASIRNEDLSSVAKLFALTVDAFVFQRSKHVTQPSDEPSGMLVMSTKVPNGTKSVPRQSFYERWIQCFLLIQKKENELLELSVLPSNAKDGASLAVVVFKLTDQSFLVQEIEQLSQSKSVSLTQ